MLTCNDERREDCFAYSKRGQCRILSTCYPAEVRCPFFKTEEVFRAGLEMYPFNESYPEGKPAVYGKPEEQYAGQL